MHPLFESTNFVMYNNYSHLWKYIWNYHTAIENLMNVHSKLRNIMYTLVVTCDMCDTTKFKV